MKLWVPSIGSMYQRVVERPASSPYSSPTSPWSGQRVEDARPDLVLDRPVGDGHERPVRLALEVEVPPEVRARGRVGGVADGEREVQPLAELRLGHAGARRRPGRPVPRVRVVGHGADDALLTTGSASRTGRTAAPGHLEAHPRPEHVDLAPAADGDVGRQVGVGDAPLDAEAVAAGRHPADDPALDADGLVAQADRARIVEHQAAQPLAGAGRARRDQRVAAQEVARLSSATANPRPASYGVSSGVMSAAQAR